MDYTIAEATVNDVPAIVDVTMQSFEDAFQNHFIILAKMQYTEMDCIYA